MAGGYARVNGTPSTSSDANCAVMATARHDDERVNRGDPPAEQRKHDERVDQQCRSDRKRDHRRAHA